MPSIIAILDPSIVASSTQRSVEREQEVEHRLALITPVSHGGLTMFDISSTNATLRILPEFVDFSLLNIKW
ncbi:MAG: hypothetical protein WBF90_21850 [Rivularia sp. (in: cyanobacteria)]